MFRTFFFLFLVVVCRQFFIVGGSFLYIKDFRPYTIALQRLIIWNQLILLFLQFISILVVSLLLLRFCGTQTDPRLLNFPAEITKQFLQSLFIGVAVLLSN